MVGIGTLYPGVDGPHLHLHAAIGKGDHALAGCLRGQATTYLVVEAIMLELAGCRAKRLPDTALGIAVPRFHTEDIRPAR
ncbi:MAG: hypothetical protein EHJ95_01030 [Methanobacteriota archaeon]|nr:MAG: hypothetical protein EHJ95_01030 [Euryarchaeota archaeon]